LRAGDLIRFGIRALTEKKLRATLTIIGILIGPATIVALEGATQGYSNATSSRFSNVGADTLYVSAIGRGTSVTSTDVPEISALPEVSYVIPYVELGGTVSQGGQSIGVDVVGVDFTQLSHALPSLSLGQGTVPSASDQTGAAIGYSVAYPDFTGASNTSLGQVISVSGIGRSAFGFAVAGGSFSSFSGSPSSAGTSARSFVVEGIYDQYGQGFGINPDDTIFVPLESAQLIAKSQTYSGVVVVASSAAAVNDVETELTDLLGTSIRVTNAGSIVSTIQSVTSGTDTLLLAVGATSVLVAFIGIMTTMLTSVMERTKEIGVLKALGSSSRGIMLAFLVEASITGVIGGVIGAGVGFGLSFLVIGYLGGSIAGLGGLGRGATSAATSGGGFSSFGLGGSSASTTLTITPAITPELVALSILLAVAVGTLGGLLPAWRASRLNPVEALRRS